MSRIIGVKLLAFSLLGIITLLYVISDIGQFNPTKTDTPLIPIHGKTLFLSESLASQQSIKRLEVSKSLLSLPDLRSLFHKVNILDEIRTSIIGSPLDPLPDFKNPCWVGSVNARDPYANNPRVKHNFSHVMIEEFQQHTIHGTSLSWRLRCFPYAMLIGVSKSGTTDLFDRMISHPDILKPAWKETRFWNRQRIGRLRLARSFDLSFTNFIDFFDNAAHVIWSDARDTVGGEEPIHDKITMEGTPHYLWDYEGWESIPGNRDLKEPMYILPNVLSAISPQLKFIAILRNPTDRLYSQFRMMSLRASVMDFHQLVTRALAMWSRCLEYNSVRGCAYNASLIPYEYTHPGGMTLRAGMYNVFLEDWFKIYPKTAFHIIKAEDYYKDIPAQLSEVFSFLGVSPLSKVQLDELKKGTIKNSNANKKHSVSVDMLPETRKLLDDFYRPFNQKLASILGNEFKWSVS